MDFDTPEVDLVPEGGGGGSDGGDDDQGAGPSNLTHPTRSASPGADDSKKRPRSGTTSAYTPLSTPNTYLTSFLHSVYSVRTFSTPQEVQGEAASSTCQAAARSQRHATRWQVDLCPSGRWYVY